MGISDRPLIGSHVIVGLLYNTVVSLAYNMKCFDVTAVMNWHYINRTELN